MGRPTLLVDGDLCLYRAASACESETDWGNDVWTMSTNLKEVKDVALQHVKKWREDLNGDRVLFCMSDPKHNFRKDIYPDYKANRKDQRKPMGWTDLQEWVRSAEFAKTGCEVFERPSLEADDCMGIMATRPGSNCIIVSDDKDFLSVPARFYRVGLRGREPEMFDSSKTEADMFFLKQTLMGDPTDGYKGCPGIGEVKAENIILDLFRDALGPDCFGYNEGSLARIWEGVVAAYLNSGLTEEVALINARMARILRWTDYDRDKKEPILWTPAS